MNGSVLHADIGDLEGHYGALTVADQSRRRCYPPWIPQVVTTSMVVKV